MDVESFLSITNSIWGFTGIFIGTVSGLWTYFNAICPGTTYSTSTGYMTTTHTQTTQEICDYCFPCSITNIVCNAITADDDNLTNVTNEDYKIVLETLISLNQLNRNQEGEEIAMDNLENQNSQQERRTNTNIGTTNTEAPITNTNALLSRIDLLREVKKKIVKKPVRLLKGASGIIAFPSLINSFIETNNNQAKIARIFTIGAPVFQEVGLNILSVINYVTFTVALFVNLPRFIGYVNGRLFPILYIMWGLAMTIASYYYSSKLTDPIEKFFLISIMTVRTFGGLCVTNGPCITNCRPLDFASIFVGGINLWFAIQNLKWTIGGVDILNPNVGLWRPF